MTELFLLAMLVVNQPLPQTTKAQSAREAAANHRLVIEYVNYVARCGMSDGQVRRDIETGFVVPVTKEGCK